MSMLQQALNQASVTYDGHFDVQDSDGLMHLLKLIGSDDWKGLVAAHEIEVDEGDIMIVRFDDYSSITFVNPKGSNAVMMIRSDNSGEFAKQMAELTLADDGLFSQLALKTSIYVAKKLNHPEIATILEHMGGDDDATH